MKLPARVFTLALLVVTTACWDTTVTYDITSEESLQESYIKMLAQTLERHGAEETRELEHAFQIIFEDFRRNAPYHGYGHNAEVRRVQEYLRPLHGMTAIEIVNYAKTLPNWVPREEVEVDLSWLLKQLECPGYVS